MQWSGINGGAAPFEGGGMPAQFTTQYRHEALPTGLHGGAVWEAQVRHRKSEAQAKHVSLPETAGIVRPVLEAQVQTRNRKSDYIQHECSTEVYHTITPFNDSVPYDIVQRPRMQIQNSVTPVLPQFMGFGVSRALPTEYISRRDQKPVLSQPNI